MPTALPPYVPPCAPGAHFSMIACRDTTALTGIPEAMPLATVMMSGTTPKCSKPHILPVRPMPVWISSRISRMPCLSQSSRSFCMNQRAVGTR